MTQAGKRRREGVVEVPDFEGLYAAQKAVKKRRRGVVKPPVLEELQLPEQHAVLAGNGVCDANNNSPVAEGDAETTNRVDEGAKDEATKTRHSSSTCEEDQRKSDQLSPVIESGAKEKEREGQDDEDVDDRKEDKSKFNDP